MKGKNVRPITDLKNRTKELVQEVAESGEHLRARGAGPPRAPLKGLNKDDKRQLEQVVRVLKRTVAEIEAE